MERILIQKDAMSTTYAKLLFQKVNLRWDCQVFQGLESVRSKIPFDNV